MNNDEWLIQLKKEKEKIRAHFKNKNKNISETKIEFMAKQNIAFPKNNDWK